MMDTHKELPRHWHITRDIRPKGECPACDIYWAREEARNKEAKE
jgi:hypothetical protein